VNYPFKCTCFVLVLQLINFLLNDLTIGQQTAGYTGEPRSKWCSGKFASESFVVIKSSATSESVGHLYEV